MSEKQHKARYQQVKGRETITIRRNSRSEQIVIVLPAEPELLKEALQHLPKAAKQRKASSSRQRQPYGGDYLLEELLASPSGQGLHPEVYDTMAKALENKEYRKLFSKIAKHSVRWMFLSARLRNCRVIDLTPDAKGAQENLDRAEWAKTSKEAFTSVNKENAEEVIVNVTGGIPEGDKLFIFDQITQQLPVIPAHFLSSPSRSSHTCVEVTLFGSDLRKPNMRFL